MERHCKLLSHNKHYIEMKLYNNQQYSLLQKSSTFLKVSSNFKWCSESRGLLATLCVRKRHYLPIHLLTKTGKNLFSALNFCYWMSCAGNLKVESLNLNCRNNCYVSSLCLPAFLLSFLPFFSLFFFFVFNSCLPDIPTLTWNKAQHLKIAGL